MTNDIYDEYVYSPQPANIVDITNGRRYALHEGRIVLGRESKNSDAEIQVPSPRRYISRDHLLFEVAYVEDRGYVHKVCLCKDRVNETYIEDGLLYPDELVVLTDQTVIRLPEAELVIEFVDADEPPAVYRRDLSI